MAPELPSNDCGYFDPEDPKAQQEIMDAMDCSREKAKRVLERLCETFKKLKDDGNQET